MTCELGDFLAGALPALRATIAALKPRYDYVSALGADSRGLSFTATPRERRAADSPWTERGFAFRAQKGGVVVEHATHALPEDAGAVAAALDALFVAAGDARRYPALPDEPAAKSRFSEVAVDPFSARAEDVFARLEKATRATLAASDEIPYAQASAEFMKVAKVFVSPNRDLAQAFVWGQCYLAAVGRRGEVSKRNYESYSGPGGLELLDALDDAEAARVAAETVELLGARAIEPGEYEVVATPDITGLIAHEAFGHGVETDMFDRKRAKAAEYLGKPVASAIVDMYDGAAGVDHCGSYLFDDEGNFATSTKIIDRGILVSGISDSLSAAALGFSATGNGRRQSFDHKAYARMTNTWIAPGESKAEDLVASVRHGFLLEKMNSGMEDPKNWGIQLVVSLAREIRDGKLTGAVYGPVVCSGYVPRVLSDVSMVSRDFELRGSGYCGKGHKEYVKVSAGGPWIKTKMRLG